MVTVSLCMIVRNEEKSIDRCLRSVAHLVDEIVIVDTGSTDATKDICREYTDYILDFPWNDDFAEARNFAFAHANKDFIFWLDADDVMSEEDQEKLQQLKQTLTLEVDAVSMPYHLTFNSEGVPEYSLRRHRLVKRSNRFRWFGAVHEYLEVRGNIIHSDAAVEHRPTKKRRDTLRNIRIYENMLAQGKTFTPRDMYYYANELKDHGRYKEAVTYYEQFLATDQGWVEDVIEACNKLSDCYIQLQNNEKALTSLLQALRYDYPRAETCCRIGHVFFERQDWRTAIFWYQSALASARVKPDVTPMFLNKAYATWIPHLQLCVCYDRIGSHLLAYLHNEQAANYMPDSHIAQRNREYLAPLAKKQQEALKLKAPTHFPDSIPHAASDDQSLHKRREESS